VIHPGPPLFVEDLGSSNGTRLSGRRLPIRKPELVPRGALVEIGVATVVLEGSEYWSGLMEWISSHGVARGMLTVEDLAQAEVADGVEDVMGRLRAGISASG
jgi:pSer/pThr/pTyr-binding forkhead associated (FHA) protein